MNNISLFIKNLIIFIIIIFLFANLSCTNTKGNKMNSSKEIINTLFENMKVEAKWEPDKYDMLFGYFFTCRDKNKLLQVSELLKQKGYRLKEIRKDELDDFYWLHMEKNEKHTVDSLFKRNQQLNDIANEYKLDSYDGWDVGPVEKQ